jgi:hypothetical protein
MNKWLIHGAAAAALLLPALSQAVTVNGVTWDETSPFDLQIESIGLRETSVGAVGEELSGFGRVGDINNADANTFCPGCELTFFFDGFIVESIVGSEVLFSGGQVVFRVDNTPNFSQADVTTAQDGDIWLVLAGHELMFDIGSGTLLGDFNGAVSAPTAGSFGIGYFDVVDGPAAPYVDTNGQLDGSDFSFTSSFQVEDAGNPDFPISGTGELQGSTQQIPEPSAVALIGFGLLGFAFAGRRRRDSK